VNEVLEDQAVVYSLPGYADGDPVPDCLSVRLLLTWTSQTGAARSLALAGTKR
jgi:hypothetical protein